MARNFFEQEVHFESEEDVSVEGKQKPVSSPTVVAGNDSGYCFDCNICLESAHDPVVTLCGHLYCWPCIYKWVQVQSSSQDALRPQPNCPVCKANVSLNLLVPLYGRGKSPPGSDSGKPILDAGIPCRPFPSALNTLITNSIDQNHPQSESFYHHQYFPDPYRGYAAMATSNFRSTTMTSIFNPMMGMFGDPVFARISRTSQMSLFAYPNLLLGGNNPRMRRLEVQLEKSLNRLTIFLICCIVLCLLLF